MICRFLFTVSTVLNSRSGEPCAEIETDQREMEEVECAERVGRMTYSINLLIRGSFSSSISVMMLSVVIVKPSGSLAIFDLSTKSEHRE
jgi:hypothetical protein